MLVMLGGECNRSFAHYKYSIASPPGSLHFHPLLFYHPGRGSRIGFLQVPSFRLPTQRISEFFTASEGPVVFGCLLLKMMKSLWKMVGRRKRLPHAEKCAPTVTVQ